jgi:hypothetical protein
MLLLALQVAIAAPTPYWQQRVAYTINASLDEPSGVLSGHARIVYFNQSPDTLRDFYVHQYLNAFRPGSRWSAVDSAEGRNRFQHMRDPDYAFERITRSTVMGEAITPDYPNAPDSTIAHWRLPQRLAPGDSMVVEIDWLARPSTLPRRQGRRGRRFDFAQWYPRVVVYDKLGWQPHPLYPAGEFYGEFGTYDVTLDLPEDQVIGSTGVAVEGDPGWEDARADKTQPVTYQRDWYGPVISGRPPARQPGRKAVRFVARDVHHFAFSLNPDYRYEEGRYGGVVVRVLYLPEDSATWGQGIAVQRTEAALGWLDTLFGKFPWPQITNVHRIDGGGTEFPMMIMDGSAGQGLITHEVGHNYLMGILANNEWREGWLDEGFTEFQTAWFNEVRGEPTGNETVERNMLDWDLEGWSQPVALPGEAYRDFTTYNNMIYNKGRLFFQQLRYVVGDSVMRQILRTYYDRWRLKHVDELAFRSVAEEASQRDLGWLFGQLHDTPLYDARIKKVERERTRDGGWRTTVVVQQLGDGRTPIEIGDKDVVFARSIGLAAEERVTFETRRRPGRLRLDPHVRSRDWNMLNNWEPTGLLFRNRRPRDVVRLDLVTKDTSRRDATVTRWLPVVWYNDFGGVMIGAHSRSSYLGRVRRGLNLGGVRTRGFRSPGDGRYAQNYAFYSRNSFAFMRSEGTLAWWHAEGRGGASLSIDRSLRRRRMQSTDPRVGFDLTWMAVTNTGYLDARLWENGGTVEAGPWIGTTIRKDSTDWRIRAGLRGGVVYRHPTPGFESNKRYDVEGFARATVQASVRGPGPGGTRLGARVFGGGYAADHSPLLQRRIFVAGADPYQTFTQPMLRSRGALFVRPDFQYHAPGDANLRAFRPDLGGRWAVSLNLEASRPLLTRSTGFARQIALGLFADGGLVDSRGLSLTAGNAETTALYDAGIGLTASLRIGALAWTTRFEFPFLVSRFTYSADPNGRDARTAFRWQVSLEPSF